MPWLGDQLLFHAVFGSKHTALMFYKALRTLLLCCSGRRSPETPEQREFVKNFINKLREMDVLPE